MWTGNFANPLLGPPEGPRCVILPDPNSDDTPNHKCNNPVGERTILDYPICDECFSFVSLERP